MFIRSSLSRDHANAINDNANDSDHETLLIIIVNLMDIILAVILSTYPFVRRYVLPTGHRAGILVGVNPLVLSNLHLVGSLSSM